MIFLKSCFSPTLVALGFHCCTQAFSCCGDGGALFFVAVHRLLIAGAPHCGGSSRGVQALGTQASVAAAQGLPGCGSRALEGVESRAWARWLYLPAACGIFQTRDRTHVLCAGRRVLIHRTTRECGAMKYSPRPAATSPEILLETNIL